MKSLEDHPLAGIFPLLERDEFARLKEDIQNHGLRESITLFQGKILDGRNRYRACLETGMQVRTREFSGGDPAAYVVSLNLADRKSTRLNSSHLVISYAVFCL